MSVKASVSLTDQQDQFARALVAKGHYSSLSAVVQRGLELVRHETERHKVELEALGKVSSLTRSRRLFSRPR